MTNFSRTLGYPFRHRISELGERTCTIFGMVVHLPSVLDKFVLDFRSSAASRNYGDPKTSRVEISVENGPKLGVFAPCKILGTNWEICHEQFLVQPGARQLVYIRRCSACPVRRERRVSDKFLTYALWGSLCTIGSHSWGNGPAPYLVW